MKLEDFLQQFLAIKSVAILVVALLLVLGERICHQAPWPDLLATARAKWSRWGRNLGLWLVNVLLSPLVILPLTLWASQHAFDWRPAVWSGLWGLLVDLLLLDFLIYWWHRANHELPLLWRFHAVHHRDRFLDCSSALRFHFGEVLLSASARAVVVIMMGFPFSSIVVFETMVFVAALFHHSNLALPPRLEQGLSRVIITPSIHWLHHHAIQADTDSSYGTFFSFWDRLFASRSANRRQLYMPIGISNEPQDGSFFELLAQPFRSGKRP